MNGKFGPIGSTCPGNHAYNTRRTHNFEVLLNITEQNESNHADFENSIGICNGILEGSCLHVGYPGMMCLSCTNKGCYNKMIKPVDDMLIDVFVVKYYAACERAHYCPLRKIEFNPTIEESDSEELDDDMSIFGPIERYDENSHCWTRTAD